MLDLLYLFHYTFEELDLPVGIDIYDSVVDTVYSTDKNYETTFWVGDALVKLKG